MMFQPTGQPMPGQPMAYGQPMQGQPMAYGQPMQGQPMAYGQPMQGQPMAYGQPMQGQPMAYGQPMQGQPMAYGQPMQGQPMAYGQPMPMGQPMQGQPMPGQPMAYGQPMPGQPMPMRPPAVWMPPIATIPGCPPGLEYLTQVDSLHVHQIADMIEMVAPIEIANKYKILNARHEQCYFAVEQSGVFQRHFGGNSRPFRINIIDNIGRVVFYIDRPWACCPGCCGDEVLVHLYNGSTLGKITHPSCSCNFHILNEADVKEYVMKGPPCGGCCGSAKFDVYPDGSNDGIAQVRKDFAGVFKELYTDADVFSVEFPLDLDVRMKAVLLGSVFLLDFAYYESTPTDPKQKNNLNKIEFNFDHKSEKKNSSDSVGPSALGPSADEMWNRKSRFSDPPEWPGLS